MKRMYRIAFVASVIATSAAAQGSHDMQHAGAPRAAGQYAFATISEIVGILEADSSTDWSKVNLEAHH